MHYLIRCLVGNEERYDRSVRENRRSAFGVRRLKTTGRSFWGLGFEKFFSMKSTVEIFFNEISSANFFSMQSASMNSTLEIFFKFFAMKSALEIFSNFSKKINIQTTDRSVQNFWGLGFGMFAISPIPARQFYSP